MVQALGFGFRAPELGFRVLARILRILFRDLGPAEHGLVQHRYPQISTGLQRASLLENPPPGLGFRV